MATQSFLDTLPAALDFEGEVDPWAAFLVSSPPEAMALLRQLRDSSVPVNLNQPDGRVYATTLWSIDAERQLLSFNAADSVSGLRPLLECERVVAVAYLDNVKLQFDLRELKLARGVRANALQCPTPRQMYRFQRRDYYRVRTDDRQSPRALLRHPGMPQMSLALRVMDVSVGGCGLLLRPETPAIKSGSVVAPVRFELDSEATFQAGFVVRHQAELGEREGVRLGCAWHNLDTATRRELQRYIELMQKRKRLLSLT